MSSRPLEAGSGHQALSDQALAASGLAPTEIERLSGVARSAAAAGAAVLQQFYGHLEQIREKGRAGDLVTEADLAAEAAVLEVLSAQTPELGVLAEESGRHPSEAALEWCVDPLDGTTNYAHSYPFFATSVGLTWRGCRCWAPSRRRLWVSATGRPPVWVPGATTSAFR